MNECEAENFLRWAGWRTPSEQHAEHLAENGGHCRKCFRGDYWEPPAMCGDCEDRLIEAEYAAEERAFVDELEFERDIAFDALTRCSPQAKATEVK